MTRLSVYVDPTSTATTLSAGLYADLNGHPGALLTQGTLNAPAAGAWNDIPVTSATVSLGTSYWVALLGPAGSPALRFRTHGAGGSAAEVSAQTNLLTLPSTWSSGATAASGPVSAWIGGTVATGAPDQIGQWSAPSSWPIVAVHMALLPTGNILAFDAWDDAPNSQTIWNPTTGTFLPVPDSTNLFCSGHVLLPDGRVLVVGGNVQADVGIKDTSIFNSTTNTWSKAANMSVARWYPTATVLGNGKVFVFSGDNIVDMGLPFAGPTYFKEASQNSLPSVYDPSTGTWQDLTGAKLTSPLYPFLFQLSDGRILDAGPDVTTRVMNLATSTWSTIGTSPIDGGDAVMYLPDKIMKSGSYANTDYYGSATLNTGAGTAVIDMSQSSPTWRTTAAMHYPRAYHNMTLLPDGSVLASGGTTASDGTDLSKAVLPAELWDPATETWKVVAALKTGREYHSTALLLPDGRVLMAGGGQLPGRATNITNGEIYSPPYLFKGARPTISAAPSLVQYGANFTVSTPNAASIQKVALIRTPSVTHAFDENQRYVPLSFTVGSGQLTVQAPPNGNTAPPGYYMLFVVNGSGVPSVASFIRFPAPYEDTQAPSTPGNLTATGAANSAALSWNGVHRQRRGRAVRHLSLDDLRLRAGAGQQGRPGHRHDLHGRVARRRHLLLRRQGRGRRRQPQRCLEPGDRHRDEPRLLTAHRGDHRSGAGHGAGDDHGDGERERRRRASRVSSSGSTAPCSGPRTRARRIRRAGTPRRSSTAHTRSPPSPVTRPETRRRRSPSASTCRTPRRRRRRTSSGRRRSG